MPRTSVPSEVLLEGRPGGRFARAQAGSDAARPDPGGSSPRWIAWAVLAVTGLGGAFIFWSTRGLTFTLDEWDFVQERSGGGPLVDDFLVPHNQHLLALVALIYKGLFATAGLDDYWAYRLAAVVAHLACVLLLFQFARRRVGDALAAFVVLPVLVLGSGWLVLLYPFNIQLPLAIAALLGVLVLLDRSHRRYDALICGLLVVAVASASPGVPAALGVLAAFLAGRQWRRLWVPAVPLALYGTWFLVYGIDAGTKPSYEPRFAPGYVADTAAWSIGALLGLPRTLSAVASRSYLDTATHLLALALAFVLLCHLVARGRRVTPQMVLLITTTGVYWGVLSVTRAFAGVPYHPNYVYVGAFLVLLLGLEFLRGRTVPTLIRAGLALVLCTGAALNAVTLVHFSNERRRDATFVTADVSALEIARPDVDPSFKPDPNQNRGPTITAGPYFEAVDRLDSSPTWSPATLATRPEYARAAADAVLVRALSVGARRYNEAVASVLDAARPNVDRVELNGALAGTGARRRGRCITGEPAAGGRVALDLILPALGAVVQGPPGSAIDLRMRRFASRYPVPPLATLRRRAYVSAPRGVATRPWRMRVSGAGPIRVC